MNSGAERAQNFFEHRKWSIFFFTKDMANDDFSGPPRRADPKIPFLFFAEFRVWVTSAAGGVGLGRILGGRSIEPFVGGRVSSQGVVSTPYPRPGRPGTSCRPGGGCPTVRCGTGERAVGGESSAFSKCTAVLGFSAVAGGPVRRSVKARDCQTKRSVGQRANWGPKGVAADNGPSPPERCIPQTIVPRVPVQS